MPPVLRICTGATCPRKKTWSGKILLVISAAFRAASVPGGAATTPDDNPRANTNTAASSRFLRFIKQPRFLVGLNEECGENTGGILTGERYRWVQFKYWIVFGPSRSSPGLLELPSKASELLFQALDLFLQIGYLLFQLRETIAIHRALCLHLYRRRGGVPLRLLAAQQMRIAGFLGSWLPGKDLHQRFLARHQALQRRLHVRQVLEAMHPFGAAAQFARRLGTSKHKHAQQCRVGAHQVERLLHAMLILGHSAVGRARCTRQPFLIQ